MYSNTLTVYNQLFTLLALLVLVITVLSYNLLAARLSKMVRLSLVGAGVLVVLASLFPGFALLIAISFIPAFIYHALAPLALLPYIIWPLAFAACFSVLVLLQELFNLVNRNAQPLQLNLIFVAILIFAGMGHLLSNGFLDYKIIYHAEEILGYAEVGTNPGQLEKIYTQVAISHDADIFKELLMKLANNPSASPALLRVVYARATDTQLAEGQRNYIFAALSKNPHAASDLLKKLLVTISQDNDAQPNALASAPHNPNFSQETLLQLVAYPDCEIRRAIIGYPNISENILTKIIDHDPDVGVRRDAKRRLDFLHGISHLEVDNRSTQNKSPVPAEKIADPAKLAAIYNSMDMIDDPDEVLASLAENCHITDAMARDIYAKANMKKGYARTSVLIALSANPKTPADVLNYLAVEKDLAVLRSLAGNPHISYEIIDRFAPYPDCKIRKEIICSPRASTDVLKRLRADSDESVAQEASERLSEQSAYLDICREFRKVNPTCDGYDGPSAPEMRAYPNTSERKALNHPLAEK
jgi:hypothetical protein